MAIVTGTIYGVALNDREQRAQLAASFEKAPYNKPPRRPVLYIKPRNCLIGEDDVIPLPRDLERVEAAPSLALVIGRDARSVTLPTALDHVAGACLALDIGEAGGTYYRPPTRQRCRDGFLRLGAMAAFDRALLGGTIETSVNGEAVGRWSLERLVLGAAQLIADITSFMTLTAGDLLLTGVRPDPPSLAEGDRIAVQMTSMPGLSACVRRDGAP